jgi:hypothetical protein
VIAGAAISREAKTAKALSEKFFVRDRDITSSTSSKRARINGNSALTFQRALASKRRNTAFHEAAHPLDIGQGLG